MEFLKEHLGDELYNQVAEKLKDKVKIADLSTGEYVAKGKFDTAQTKIDALEQKVKERDAQITELSKVDAKDLQAKIEAANKKNQDDAAAWEAEKQKYEKQLADIKLNEAMMAKLGEFKDPKDALALIDKSKVSLDNGNLLGFDEQVKTLKESKDYLLKEAIGDTGTTNPDNVKAPNNMTPYTRQQLEGMSPAEINANRERVEYSLKSIK